MKVKENSWWYPLGTRVTYAQLDSCHKILFSPFLLSFFISILSLSLYSSEGSLFSILFNPFQTLLIHPIFRLEFSFLEYTHFLRSQIKWWRKKASLLSLSLKKRQLLLFRLSLSLSLSVSLFPPFRRSHVLKYRLEYNFRMNRTKSRFVCFSFRISERERERTSSSKRAHWFIREGKKCLRWLEFLFLHSLWWATL